MSVSVEVDGEDQTHVSKDIHNTMVALQKLLHQYTPKSETGEATPDAPITHWSMTSLTTSFHDPVDRNGKPLPRKHNAKTQFDIKFRDFVRLGKIATELSTMEFVRINNISWRLTDATKEGLGSQSRIAAVENALMKAKDFAKPLGEKVPRAVELTEQGFTTSTASHMRARKGMRTDTGTSDPRTDGMEFEPEDVQLSANVTVKFVVD
jgi:uncharacterized protein YggE